MVQTNFVAILAVLVLSDLYFYSLVQQREHLYNLSLFVVALEFVAVIQNVSPKQYDFDPKLLLSLFSQGINEISMPPFYYIFTIDHLKPDSCVKTDFLFNVVNSTQKVCCSIKK